MKKIYNIPSYSDALELSSRTDVFYESKTVVDGYSVSTLTIDLLNFLTLKTQSKVLKLNGYEMRE
jgi:hypothetical protein